MLDSFCLFLQKLPLQAKPKYKYNVSALERQAIRELSNNIDLVIKEADKGSSIVIMHYDFYKREMLKIVNDPCKYKKITKNQDNTVINKIKKN